MSALKRVVALLAVTTAGLAALTLAGPSADAHSEKIPHAQLAKVRAATAKYHKVPPGNGYELLDVCFDSDAGGMGYHYLKGIDAVLDPLAPEALVYEPTDDGLKLVAVEYIVPEDLSNTPPSVLGHELHLNSALHLWVLHAWIWKPNPAGMFEDFNPDVTRCPT